jgi:hypothetical protein
MPNDQLRPIVLSDEKEATRQVIKIGKKYGFGNMMTWLAWAWVKHLIVMGLDKETALKAVWIQPYSIENPPFNPFEKDTHAD